MTVLDNKNKGNYTSYPLEVIGKGNRLLFEGYLLVTSDSDGIESGDGQPVWLQESGKTERQDIPKEWLGKIRQVLVGYDGRLITLQVD